jgi:hypothetical protein
MLNKIEGSGGILTPEILINAPNKAYGVRLSPLDGYN